MTARLLLRVGNQSAFSARPWTQPFAFAVGNGFEAFEWFPDRKPDGAGFAISDITALERHDLRARARDAGIALSVHAPIHADPLRNGKELEESARVSGATWFRTYWRVLLPLLAPTVFTVGILSFLSAIRDISIPVLLYSADSRPLSILMLEYSFSGEMERGAAIGVLVAVFVMIVTLTVRGVAFRLTRERV